MTNTNIVYYFMDYKKGKKKLVEDQHKKCLYILDLWDTREIILKLVSLKYIFQGTLRHCLCCVRIELLMLILL